MNRIISRTWVSPVTSVSFIVVAITGIFLAFHIKSGSIKTVHEWLGYLFVVIGLAHLLINAKTFICHFQKPVARFATAACIALVAAVTAAGGSGKNQAGKHPAIRMFDSNADGVIDSREIQTAVSTLNKLDMEHNGTVPADALLTSLSTKPSNK